MNYDLKETWTLWYDYLTNKQSINQNDWMSNLNIISEVKNIPSFLYLTENIEPADKWPSPANVHFFRKDIKPMWEDEKNKEGGKWVLEIEKSNWDINDIWNKTMAFCISELVEGEICGAVFSPRKFLYRISLWTRSTDENVCMKIGEKWKDIIDGNKRITIGFKTHNDNLKGYTVGNRFEIK
ncbi:Eukaryotic translation initiation factor IF4E [Spraguea lophii 42_110]|uniref:Eukaryotic translation initiation factor IF4E n=1 Tax=Spraguea lophii (strain 42_110) TaxID=1358809 RepID=S7W5F2_SPRLO|nr:Eukaryotic translation initiation factor IF4E [Spraguea lophii 42_110]